MEFRLWIGATVFCLAFAGIFCDNSTTVEVFTNNSITFLQNTADVDLAPAISENTTFGRDCNTTLDCNSAMSCHNGLCVCPAKSLKVSGTCVGILGLDCSALGQCEQHVANSICDFSTASAGICVCKPGYAAWNLQLTLPTESNTSSRHLYVIANNTCTAVLNAECEGNEGLCSNVDNAKCAVFGTSTKKRCVCADGLRPKGATQRTAIADSFHSPGSSEEPSTSCEDVIGNHCSASGTDYPDCSLFVKNTYCDNETERCTCKEGFTVNNLTKLCENDTIRSQNNATAGNMSRVAVSPFTDEYQLFLTSRCFMLNYPCAVENSICMHSPFSLYEGVCHCEPGYVQTSYTTCESVDGPADEKPGVDTDDIRTTTENPVTTTKATKPSKTTKATTTAKTAKPVKTTTATATATTDGATIDTTDGPSTEAETTETSTDSGATEKPPVTATTAPAMTNPRNCGVPKSAKSRKSGISRQFGVRYPSHDSEDMKKIVGGQAAQENEICWQAGVISFMPNLQNYEYCGGSILNENFVLTAMHCVVQNSDVNHPTQLDHIFVSVGASSFPKPSSANTGCGSFRKVSRVIINPDAAFITKGDSPEFLGIANDLALIELEEPLDLDMGCICAICLLDERPAAGEECIISGYGCQDAECQSPPPHSLSWMKVPIVAKNDDRCQHGSTQLSTDSLVCIESTTDQDACQGDSGGPLSCYEKSTEKFYLAGATSYGFGGNGRSCAAGQLARYTDVIYFLDWIRSVIGNDQN